MVDRADWMVTSDFIFQNDNMHQKPPLAHAHRYKQLAAERTMVAAEAEAAAAAVAKAARGSSPDGDAQRDGSAEPDRAAADDRAPDPAEPAALPISVVKVCCLTSQAATGTCQKCTSCASEMHSAAD